MKGTCTDLRNVGHNSPVKVFCAVTGKLKRIEPARTIDDFVGKTPNVPKSRRSEPPFGTWLVPWKQ